MVFWLTMSCPPYRDSQLCGAVLSSPASLSLVPGTPQQIKEMAENWGIPFRGPATTWADRSPFSQTATNDTAPFLRKKVRDDVRFN